jgi:hypothetical protein
MRIQFGDCLEAPLFLPSPDKKAKSIEKASLALAAGEVHALLRQQIIGAVATVIAIATLSGVAAFL